MQKETLDILTGKDGIGKYRKQVAYELLAKEKATEQQWALVQVAIDAFSMAYPKEWLDFCQSMQFAKTPENPYSEARDGDLKKAEFRHTCSFPVVLDEEGFPKDGLYPVLQNIIPGLTHKDSKNFREFLRRFPVFSSSYKLNV